ncbi:ATPase [Candidatus Peregrinibacteria bacterium]|nr:MAG: ATPase [Candidatus Peregrinibacteria bacterium]
MYKRKITSPKNKSFFLFGPRGTGKTTWLKTNFPDSIYIDLLESDVFNDLLSRPQRLESFIPSGFQGWVVIDEVQRVPELLQEVHRLIEKSQYTFVLTGSSARKLKKERSNLLAGRALSYSMYPLTALELESDFDFDFSLQYGFLPSIFCEDDPKRYLESYVMTYLEQEILQEGLTRNLSAFSRFLEVASFSQGCVLNLSEIARESAIHRKVVENYFSILIDLMIAYRLPVFSRKAKRRLVSHDKFYYFDVGVFRTLRPKGPLDKPSEIDGAALETMVFQELKAVNDFLELGYKLYYWRTDDGKEVDFVLYGERGIIGIEVKRKKKISSGDLKGLRLFLKDYPGSRSIVLYGGDIKMYEGDIEIIPLQDFLQDVSIYL